MLPNNIKLSKIKVGKNYTFKIYYDYGCGSGSQGWYYVSGKVKEINAEFIRVISLENQKAGNTRSTKLFNHSIVAVTVTL